MPDGDLIPLILGSITLITPVVWILTKHQQRMTQLLHGGGGPQAIQQNSDLQREITSLKEVVNQQTIALDNLARSQAELRAALQARDDIQQRVNS